MMQLQLDALDTLFFRDGTPFAADSSGPSEVGGIFPPHPGSITGALRAALARANGWSGAGRWSASLNAALGPGPDDLGLLSFTGPFLLRHGEVLVAAPRHLLGVNMDDAWVPQALLQPGPPVSCDLGANVRLPDLPVRIPPEQRADLKPTDGWWLTLAGLESVLNGEIPPPGALVPSAELWREERRIGIARDTATRTASEGMLYFSRHVRLAPGVGLGVRIDGLDRDWKSPIGALLPLGGESRMAECSTWEQELCLAMPLKAISASGRLLIVALTPLDLPLDQALGRSPLTGCGGARVISACLGRPQRIGGWDSLARRPLPLRSYLPAGSVLFCELTGPGALEPFAAGGGDLPRLGGRQRWGYGVVAFGTWTDLLD